MELPKQLRAALALSFAALLGFAGQAAATPITAVTITPTSENSTNDTDGWRFQALTDISVTDLGVYDDNSQDGLTADTEVGLWTDAGTLLVSATLPAGTSATLDGLFRYVSIAPIDLMAGEFYRIASSITSGATNYINVSSLTTAPEIAYDQGYYAASNNTLTFPNISDGTPSDPDFFGPNFKFEAVPEPATLALMSLGLAGIGYRQKKAA